jgi:hypothetical protein
MVPVIVEVRKVELSSGAEYIAKTQRGVAKI